MKATFRVENVNALKPGLKFEAVFSQLGGFIGSGVDSTWQVQDNDGSIAEAAARITTQGQHFTIEALHGAKVQVNEARSALPVGRAVILSDKDRIRLGNLNLLLSLPSRYDDEMRSQSSGSVGHMIGGDDAEDALVVNGEMNLASDYDPIFPAADARDPILALGSRSTSRQSADPMAAFDTMARKEVPDQSNDVLDEVVKPTLDQAEEKMGDRSDWHFSAMPTPHLQRDAFGFEELDPAKDVSVAGTRPITPPLDDSDPVDHIALRPLARALGIPFGEMSTEDAHRILAEIGASLRKTLEGLNRLYRAPQGKHGHFQLSKMHLHALEDNPIQFSEDADQALHAFFSKRGPVHLSAPSAFEETMNHLIAHQGASEHAIDEALSTLMSALSPVALQKRFRAYERDERPLDQDEMDSWCWRMYKAYFSELYSERQRGLQMLFWEVFAQEYQQDMRRRERDRYLAGGEDV